MTIGTGQKVKSNLLTWTGEVPNLWPECGIQGHGPGQSGWSRMGKSPQKYRSLLKVQRHLLPKCPVWLNQNDRSLFLFLLLLFQLGQKFPGKCVTLTKFSSRMTVVWKVQMCLRCQYTFLFIFIFYITVDSKHIFKISFLKFHEK